MIKIRRSKVSNSLYPSPAQGWKGYFKGTKQVMGTYVWMAGAKDYRGNKIQRKGSVILIR